MTPVLFDALLKRKQVQDRREDFRTGIIAAAVVNFSMCHPEKHVSPMDFVPQMPGEKQDEFDLSKLDPKEQAAYVRSLFKKRQMRRRKG